MTRPYASNGEPWDYEVAEDDFDFFRVQKDNENGDAILFLKLDDRSKFLECRMSPDATYSIAMTLLNALVTEDVANKVHDLIGKEMFGVKPTEVDYHSMDIDEMYSLFEQKYNPYPVQMSRCEAFGHALKDGLIDKEIYEKARKYFGKLWMYVGD